MGFFKSQFLKVIEWKDASKDTIVYRYPIPEKQEIMTSSTLVVRESQVAVFVHKGKIADVFEAGTYKLSTGNIPFLTKMLSLPTLGESKIKAEVYFVNTKQFTGNKWGTQNPIIMRDEEFGSVRLRGFGIYSFKVADAKVFMKEMFGTNAVYTVSDVATACKPLVLQSIADTIAESKISALDLAANYREFGDEIVKGSEKEFGAYGLKLCSIVIENLSLPEDVEKMLDERTKMSVIEDKIGTYTKFKAANAMEEASKSSNSMAGMGMGLSAGVQMGNLFAENLTTTNKPKNAVKCVSCGEEISAKAKFCPICGATQGLTCPKCGTVVSKTAKFCAECGQALNAKKTCKGCGEELKANAKFCPNCGKKC